MSSLLKSDSMNLICPTELSLRISVVLGSLTLPEPPGLDPRAFRFFMSLLKYYVNKHLQICLLNKIDSTIEM